MLAQLFFTNLYFTIKVLSALVFFATGWLHIGSWSLYKKDKSYIIRGCGFFLLSVVSIFQAMNLDIEPLIFTQQLIKIIGLILILISILKEPLIHPPKKAVAANSLMLLSNSLFPFSMVLYLSIALTYLMRSTKGYEKQIKAVFFAFLLLSISELLNFLMLSSDSSIVVWTKVLSEFGLVWILSHILEIIGITILGVWTWGYIRFRAKAQLFIIFVTSSLIIFTITTISFTFLLLKNLEADALKHLATDVKVLHYAVEAQELKSLSDAKVIAENTSIKNFIKNADEDSLFETSLEFMLSQETSFLEITDSGGKVIMRAEDKEKIGDSLSEDMVVKSALAGNPLTTTITKMGAISPSVEIRAAAPIIENSSVIGVVVTGISIDNAFVDGIKTITGLDASIFAGDARAATTFIAPDGKSRFIGTKETDSKILSRVLAQGETFIGLLQVHNQPFLAAYSPLQSTDGKTIGMLFVGKPQTELFNTAERSIRLTFLGSVILMILSTIPSYFLAQYIKENIKA